MSEKEIDDAAIALRKEKARARQAAYRAANREKLIAKATAYRAVNANPEKAKAAAAKYYEANSEKLTIGELESITNCRI